MSTPPTNGSAVAPLERVLRMEGICKTFPGVTALDDVSLEVCAGEVHVLLGENGAGKSTLIKTLSGAIRPDAGTIELYGHQQQITDPLHAQRLGISTIYQEFNLVPGLSVAENIYLGRQALYGPLLPLIDWRRVYEDAERCLDSLGISGVRVRGRVGDLGVAQQQMVEIAKALSINARIIVMDEPTASLTGREVDVLFRTVERLKAQGLSFVFISHRLEEAKRIGDRATILRNGRRVATVELGAQPIAALIQMMIGRDIQDLFPRVRPVLGRELLRVEGLTREGAFADVDLHVRAGEVLGIAGLVGSGRTSLVRAIAGVDAVDSGRILVAGQEASAHSPRGMLRSGVALLPENRKDQGLVLTLSVQDNITLASLDNLSRAGFLDFRRQRSLAQRFIDGLGIRTPSRGTAVRQLSGGNQQKVVLSKYLCRGSQVLIFDEPTRGVDIGAKVEIYKLINALTADGHAVILVSSELPEVMGMSDRILVMSQGRVTGEFTREEATQEAILHCAFDNAVSAP